MSTAPRPRIITIAFWCWAVGAVLLVAFGAMQAAVSGPLFFRLLGGLLVVAGLALAFLTGRAGKGDARFARAAVALSLTLIVLLAVLLMMFGAGLFGLIFSAVIILVLIAGATLFTRPATAEWFEDGS